MYHFGNAPNVRRSGAVKAAALGNEYTKKRAKPFPRGEQGMALSRMKLHGPSLCRGNNALKPALDSGARGGNLYRQFTFGPNVYRCRIHTLYVTQSGQG
jgi:hypothetical protein